MHAGEVRQLEGRVVFSNVTQEYLGLPGLDWPPTEQDLRGSGGMRRAGSLIYPFKLHMPALSPGQVILVHGSVQTRRTFSPADQCQGGCSDMVLSTRKLSAGVHNSSTSPL